MHHGVEFLFDGQRVPVALSELTDGKSVMVYGQTEVTRDLMAARAASGAPIVYGVSEVAIHDAKSDRPTITYPVSYTHLDVYKRQTLNTKLSAL